MTYLPKYLMIIYTPYLDHLILLHKFISFFAGLLMLSSSSFFHISCPLSTLPFMTSFKYFVVALALSLLALGINLPALTLLAIPLVLALPHLHPTQRTLTAAAIRALNGLMTYPDHVVAAVCTHIVHNLPAPSWLTNWLMLISTAIADTREYAVRIDCHLVETDQDIQAQSEALVSLYQSMGTFAEQVTTTTSLLSRLLEHILSIQLTTAKTQARVNGLTDDILALYNHTSAAADRLLTHLDHRTSLSADVDLQLGALLILYHVAPQPGPRNFRWTDGIATP